MRETRQSGSEGGARFNPSSLPLSRFRFVESWKSTSLPRWLRGRSGQVNVELAALAGTDDPDRAVVGFDKIFGNGQAEPRSGFLLAWDTEKPLENVRLVLGWYPRTLI